MISFIACVQAGLIPVPVNSWGTGDDLLYVINEVTASAILCDFDRYKRIEPYQSPAPIIVVDGNDQIEHGQNNAFLFSRVISLADTHFNTPDILPDDDALILFTSGTTHRPKGVVSTHFSIAQSLFALDYQGIDVATHSPERITPIIESGLQPTSLLAVPLFHVSGLHAQFLTGLRNGRRIVLMYKWDVDDALHTICVDKCTQFNGVPAMIKQLINHPSFSSDLTKNLFALGLGGDAASPDILSKLLTEKPHAMLGSGYGLTETNGIGTAHSGNEFISCPASAGRTLPIVDLIVGETPKTPVKKGLPGPIWIRSVTVMNRYWNNSSETESHLNNGWLFTGDIGFLDDQERIHITGRLKDIIIRGGENISTNEVEHCASQHPDVVEAAAFSLIDPEFGESVGLVIFSHNLCSKADLIDFMSAHLSTYKLPSRVWISSRPLIRNATGKLQKQIIKQCCHEGIDVTEIP